MNLFNKSCVTAATCFLLLVMMLPGFRTLEESRCKLRRIVHTIKYKDCLKKNLLSYACQGTCHSYSQVSQTDLSEMESMCRCCQEIAEMTQLIGFLCPRSPGSQLYKTTFIRIKVPTRCMCRSCSTTVRTRHFEMLRT